MAISATRRAETGKLNPCPNGPRTASFVPGSQEAGTGGAAMNPSVASRAEKSALARGASEPSACARAYCPGAGMTPSGQRIRADAEPSRRTSSAIVPSAIMRLSYHGHAAAASCRPRMALLVIQGLLAYVEPDVPRMSLGVAHEPVVQARVRIGPQEVAAAGGARWASAPTVQVGIGLNADDVAAIRIRVGRGNGDLESLITG